MSNLHVAHALSFVALDGTAPKPHIVRAKLDGAGQVTEWYEPETAHSGISPESAALVRRYLVKAASSEGTAPAAVISRYASGRLHLKTGRWRRMT